MQHEPKSVIYALVFSTKNWDEAEIVVLALKTKLYQFWPVKFPIRSTTHQICALPTQYGLMAYASSQSCALFFNRPAQSYSIYHLKYTHPEVTMQSVPRCECVCVHVYVVLISLHFGIFIAVQIVPIFCLLCRYSLASAWYSFGLFQVFLHINNYIYTRFICDAMWCFIIIIIWRWTKLLFQNAKHR